MGVVDLYKSVGEATGGGYHPIVVLCVCVCVCVFVFCCLTFSVPLFRWLEDDGCCVYFFVFSLFSFSLVPLTRSY